MVGGRQLYRRKSQAPTHTRFGWMPQGITKLGVRIKAQPHPKGKPVSIKSDECVGRLASGDGPSLRVARGTTKRPLKTYPNIFSLTKNKTFCSGHVTVGLSVVGNLCGGVGSAVALSHVCSCSQ